MKIATSSLKSASLEAVVIRKDGRVENLGTISYWHRNPVRRLQWRISQWLRGRTAGRIFLRK